MNCLDSAWPSGTEAYFDAGAAAERGAPHLGEPTVLDYIRCALWPVPPQPLEPTTAAGGTARRRHQHDRRPGDAVRERRRDRGAARSAVLLTFEGNEHGVSFFGIDCIDDPVTAYLVDLTVPADGLTCSAG